MVFFDAEHFFDWAVVAKAAFASKYNHTGVYWDALKLDLVKHMTESNIALFHIPEIPIPSGARSSQPNLANVVARYLAEAFLKNEIKGIRRRLQKRLKNGELDNLVREWAPGFHWLEKKLDDLPEENHPNS
jgi:hypothetical protein